MKPITFPTRRRSTSVKRFFAACDFLMGCTLAAGGALLVVAGVVMLLVAK
jgi:hypothetical protein